jgi:uncharacterized membrane protein
MQPTAETAGEDEEHPEYAIIIMPVALVAALREPSVFFGTIFSAVILKERVTWVRAISVIMIVAGTVAIKMS